MNIRAQNCNMDHATAKHFAEAIYHSPSSLNVCGIEKEMFWTYTVNSMTRNGLNEDLKS